MNNLLALLLLMLSTQDANSGSDVFNVSRKQMCTVGYSSTIRNVSIKTKKQVYAIAGVPYGDRTKCSLGYEVDHIISLQNGGSNDISNLQLQAYCSYDQLTKGIDLTPVYKGLYNARKKDVFESKIHRDICSKKITIKSGRAQLKAWKN